MLNHLKGLFCILRYERLRGIYHFDRWHSFNPIDLSPYRLEVVHLANSRRNHCVVDVGCGLGEILDRIHADSKIGIDISPSVISAGKHLFPHLDLRVGDIFNVKGLDIDLFIAISWLHRYPPHIVGSFFHHLLSNNRVESLIIDRTQWGHSHDFSKHLKDYRNPINIGMRNRSIQLWKLVT